MASRITRLVRDVVTGTTVGLVTVALTAQPALAITATSPITASNGAIACPTCATESSPAQYSLPVWGATQELEAITPSSQTTYFLRSKGVSANPAFEALVIGDISFTSGSSGATKVVSTTSAGLTTNNCAKWDANGNLVDSGGTCGGSSINPLVAISTATPVTVASGTPVYLSLGGEASTTESEVRTPIQNAATFASLQCVANAGTTNAITATLGTAACTSAMDYTSKAAVTMSATANTTGSSSGTTSVTGGQCVAIKLTAGTSATAATIHCTVERSA